MRSGARKAAAGLAVALAVATSTGRALADERVIYIQPLGSALPDDDVAMVTTALTELYRVTVHVLPRVALPQRAFYPPRRRYRAEKLLPFLAERKPADGARILGLTAVDISTTKGKVYDWGVLGLGELDGTAGVISSFRCHRRARDPLQARERLAKVAVHEIGHTLGLEHCPTDGCLMRDAEGSVTRSDEEYDLCLRCRGKLVAAGRAAAPSPKIPWRRPGTE